MKTRILAILAVAWGVIKWGGGAAATASGFAWRGAWAFLGVPTGAKLWPLFLTASVVLSSASFFAGWKVHTWAVSDRELNSLRAEIAAREKTEAEWAIKLGFDLRDNAALAAHLETLANARTDTGRVCLPATDPLVREWTKQRTNDGNRKRPLSRTRS